MGTAQTQVGVGDGTRLGVDVLDAVGVGVMVGVLVGEAVGVSVGGGNVRVAVDVAGFLVGC